MRFFTSRKQGIVEQQHKLLETMSEINNDLAERLKEAHQDRMHLGEDLQKANDQILSMSAAMIKGSRRAVDLIRARLETASAEDREFLEALLDAMVLILEAGERKGGHDDS